MAATVSLALGMAWSTVPSHASELPDDHDDVPSEAPDSPEAPASPGAPDAPSVTPDELSAAVAPTLWVDGVYGHDSNNGEAPDTALRTLEAAVQAATPGTTIMVLPAIYSMAGGSVTLAEDVAIVGALPTDTQPRPTVTPAHAPVAGCTAWPGLIQGTIALQGDRSKVEGLTFGPPGRHQGEAAAVYVEYPDDAMIRCNIIDHADVGVVPRGILVAGARATDPADVPHRLRIQQNVIADSLTGIYLNPGSFSVPQDYPGADGWIVRNRITRTVFSAISSDTSGVLLIAENEIRDNLGTGIAVTLFAEDSRIWRNVFAGNHGKAVVAASFGADPPLKEGILPPPTGVDAAQNWWGSSLGPRTGPIAADELQPSPAPTVTPTPVPTVSPTPNPDNTRRQVEREDVGAGVEFGPWCLGATLELGCQKAPVRLSGTVVDATNLIPAGALQIAIAASDGFPAVSTDVREADIATLTAAWSLTTEVDWAAGRSVAVTVSCKTAGCGYASQTAPIDLTADSPRTTMPAFAYGRLHVTVTDPNSSWNGSGATVSVRRADGGAAVANATTPTGGVAQFGLPAGPYVYSVTAPAGYDPTSDQAVAVVTGDTKRVTYVLSKLFSISGQVVDQDGTPLSGATVTATGPVTRTCATTGANYGCSVPAGTYEVRAQAAPAHPAVKTVTVDPGLTVGPVQLKIVAVLFTAVVSVDGGTGVDADGVTLSVTAPGEEARTATLGGAGNAAFALPAGAWSVKAEADGYLDAREGPFDLSSGSSRMVSLVLRPRATSAGGGSGGGDAGGRAAAAPSDPSAPSVQPQPAPLPSQPSRADRVSGGDRAGTAASLSRSAFAGGADVVYVVTAGGFADALAGGPAAAREGGPVLLVNTDSLPESTRAEIERLGASRIVVLGGDGAVSPTVAAQLESLGAEVERVSGGDRFTTAAAVSRRTFTETGGVVYIATGDGFADALSGGAAAARNRGPVLLVNGAGVPAATGEELRRLSPSRIVVLGGSSAVPPEVSARLGEFTEGAVERLSGGDRYGTSAAIAAHGFPGTADTVYVATGENFPDALAGVPAAARERAPLLLVRRDGVPEAIAAQLGRLRPSRIVVLGGSGAVSEETERQLAGYAVE